MRFAYLVGDVQAWAKRLIDDLNRAETLPGPFADDAAAEAGGVAVGTTYRASDGALRWRVA